MFTFAANFYTIKPIYGFVVYLKNLITNYLSHFFASRNIKNYAVNHVH